MENVRIYGEAPYRVAVIHGGPGAPGTMAPVARELCGEWGVLEPLQSASTLEGQVQELHDVLNRRGDLPMALIGSSWGAMLAYIFAARYPPLVRQAILVGSAVFQEEHAAEITPTRLRRLPESEREEARALRSALDEGARAGLDAGSRDALLARLAELTTWADAYDPVTLDTEVLEIQYDVNQQVWSEARALRAGGDLLEMGRRIRCPVVAIHGDYDPHPAAGVEEPLSAVLVDFRFHLLPQCGHLPWIERRARDVFFRIVRHALRSSFT